MKAIYSVVAILGLLCACLPKSKAAPSIDSIFILTILPTENDVVKIAVYISTPSPAKRLSIVPTISPGKIDIAGCYNSDNILGGMSFLADTIILGKLPEGVHKLTFTAYYNLGYSNPNCDNIIDSAMVSGNLIILPAMPVTQEILPLNTTEKDSMKIALRITTPNPAKKISLWYSLSSNDIIVSGCFAKTQPTALPQTFHDTLTIGMLPKGRYRSYVAAFYSDGDTNICDKIMDVTQISDSFTVTAGVFVEEDRLTRTTVYPNPSSGDVNILLPDGVEIEQIAVHDITGRVLKTETGSRFSIAELPTGLYILQVQTNAGRFVQKLRKE